MCQALIVPGDMVINRNSTCPPGPYSVVGAQVCKKQLQYDKECQVLPQLLCLAAIRVSVEES